MFLPIDLGSLSVGLSIGLGLSLTPSLGRDDTYDVEVPVTIFDHFKGNSVDTSQLANRPSSLPRHEGERESDKL